jgi:hypothetical protein
MIITEICVTAARTFNHPHESYSNLRPAVSMTATLAAGEDADVAVAALQARAETLVEDHKAAMLASLDAIAEMTTIDSETARLEEQLKAAHARLQALLAKRRELPATRAIGASLEHGV